MKGVREIKRRLKSVKNIQKITRAMEMVAATKLRRLQERSLNTRPFANKIEELIRRVAGHVDADVSPLLGESDRVETEALVIVGADRGLCGSYNSNLFRAGKRYIDTLKGEGINPSLYVFGRRADAFFGRLEDAEIHWTHPDTVERVGYGDVRALVGRLSELFLEGKIQRARVLFTEMKSLASFAPKISDLLPLPRPEAGGEDEEAELDYILEPSAEVIMQRLLPRFLEMQLYAALLESLTAEFAARRMAMKSATDNADDMIGDLTQQANKARQEGITGELLDIIGGVIASE